MDELFVVPGAPWVAVSPRLASLRRAVLLASATVTALVLTTLTMVVQADRWLLAVGALVLVTSAAVAWRLIGANVASWAYAERDDDLFVRRGVAFRRFEVVPYGRMQLVDITAGPLQRRLDLATVHLHTAAPGTQARIPGLVPAEAARLRDRLTALGEAQASGL